MIYTKFARGYALAMALYYFAVTPLNFTLIAPAILPMLACTSLSGSLSIGLWWMLRRSPAPIGRLELAVGAMNVVLLFNIVLHTVLVRDAHLLIYFAPIALIFSVVGPSYRVIVPSLALNALCALLCGHFMPQAYRTEFAIAVGTIMFAASGTAWLLHGAVRQKAQALKTLKATAAALDDARRRSDALALEAEAAHAAKARFIANITHEMRNPLSGMLGLADALARTDLNPQQAESVALLQSSGRMLKRIVSDVLDMEKIEAGKVELELMLLNLAEEIGGVVRLLSAQAAEKGLVLNFECLDRDAPPVMGDPTRIKQIAINLLSNAIKFTQVGGVTVRLRMTALIDRPVVSVVIDVEDTGIGFDVSNAAWLFNRFGQAEASTTRRFGGTGLGLAISRALARQMGGDVSATSVVGEGSCFTIQLTLPIAEAAVSGDTDISPRGWENGLRILVAEDNPAIQRVIALLLASVNAQAQFVENGRDALEARRQSEFDVILMDMHMPELDGLGATRAIRAMEDALELPAVPVVMLTGNSSDADKVASQAAGAIGFVTKPVDPQALFAALGSAMKQAA